MIDLRQVAIEARRAHVPGRTIVLEAQVPAVELATLSAALPDDPMVFWAPPRGPITLGLGASVILRGRGRSRFAALRDGAAELDGELFAAFSFADGGEAIAILPRFRFRTTEHGTTLTIRVDDAAIRQLEAFSAPNAISDDAPVREDASEAARFVETVTLARDEIRRGTLDKVVVHRQTRLSHAPRTPAEALGTLVREQPDATTYAFRMNGETFLGATPERLVRREGRSVHADVLAGSAPSASAPAHLLTSAKDRGEHELTRAAIATALQPLCIRYEETGPTVRSLPHLHHLHTAVEGTLATDTHVLDVVAALHPTPAVGGSPRAAALSFLSQHEGLDRGWYAAPIGWYGPGGDGDFAVALRCAQVSRDRVTLYAGAGIVAASEPQRELAETTVKRRAMASALGLELA